MSEVRSESPPVSPQAPSRQTVRGSTTGWLRMLWLLPLLCLYVTAFWGRFGSQWPAAVQQYGGWASRVVWTWYREYFRPERDLVVHHRLLWLGLSWLLAFIVPLFLAAVFRRSPAELGLGRPNRLGWRWVAIGLVVTAVTGYVFARERIRMHYRPGATGMPPAVELGSMLAVTLPEHVFLTGVCVAAFLPGVRLRRPPLPAPVEGRAGRRLLRWLGLAQPLPSAQSPADDEAPLTPVDASPHPDAPHHPPVTTGSAPQDAPPGNTGESLGFPGLRRRLAWWGLCPTDLPAILAGGFLFGLVHVGARPVELTLSFPGGVTLCYLTIRTGSIWPGWIIHLAQIGWAALFLSVMLD